MTYEYKALYSILGGLDLPPKAESIELYSSTDIQVILLKDPTEFCKEIDISTALGVIYLRRLFMHSGDKINKDLISQEIEIIKERRREKADFSNFVTIKISRHIDLEISDVVYQDDSIIFSISENDNSLLVESLTKESDKILSSILINSITFLQIYKVAEGICFPNIDGKTLFRKKITFPRPRVINANGIRTSDVTRIRRSITNLLKNKDFDKILRLYSQMHDRRNDEVKSFIFGWTSLEIFINKNFSNYYKNFWTNLSLGNPIFIKYSEQINPILKDRLKLNDKFLIIASCLNQDSDTLVDLELFNKLKKLRDKYFHGQSINEFPINDLNRLLMKYLNLHFDKEN